MWIGQFEEKNEKVEKQGLKSLKCPTKNKPEAYDISNKCGEGQDWVSA